jgi:hypothetical protein
MQPSGKTKKMDEARTGVWHNGSRKIQIWAQAKNIERVKQNPQKLKTNDTVNRQETESRKLRRQDQKGKIKQLTQKK